MKTEAKENVIKALELCIENGYTCKDCCFNSEKHRYENGESEIVDEKGRTYDDYGCSWWLMKSALELLKGETK